MATQTDPIRPVQPNKVEESASTARALGDASLFAASIPLPVAPLIGREQLVLAVVRLLQPNRARPQVRLVTLTGPGGTGKTRLAIAVAAKLAAANLAAADAAAQAAPLSTEISPPVFADGVFFVALAAITEPNLVISAIAQGLGVLENAGQPLMTTLQQFLRERQLLLVLDNFEQVEAAAPFVGALLAAAPGLTLLITSRVVLRLAGEHEFSVPPLGLPDLSRPGSAADVAGSPAVMLFVQRAQAVRPLLQLTDENAAAIAEICGRLDGLPLAIELAAARCRILSPQALLARLASPLQLLTTGAPDLPARQQTLRATIDWSYQLLRPEEQTLFRRVAIFVGGWTLAAVEEICMTETRQPPAAHQGTLSSAALAALDRLTALVEHSLVHQEEDPTGEPRFTMLETIRDYAWERLEESGELPLLRQLHVDFYLTLAEEAEPKLTGPEQLAWLARLDWEQSNLRAALTACAQLAGGAELGLRLAAALWWYWWVRGQITEGRTWLESLLLQTARELRSSTALLVRATALYRAAFLALTQNDYWRGNALGEESLALFRTLSHAGGVAWARYMLSWSAVLQGDHKRAEAGYTESLTLFRALNDVRGILWALNDLSNLAHMQNDLTAALALANEHLALAQAIGNPREIAAGLGHLSGIVQSQGNLVQAQRYNEEALQRFRIVGDHLSIAITLHSLAYLAQVQQQDGEAERLFLAALEYYYRIGSRFGVARCLVGLSAVAGAAGHNVRAATLLGAAATQHEQIDTYFSPDERFTYEASQRTLRDELGEAAFAAAYEAGGALTPQQALAISATVTPRRLVAPAPAPPPAQPVHLPPQSPAAARPFADLTDRELDVLRLLTRGLSYAEIADQLIISPRTVNRHLTSIYTKLNVTSRHAATRLALDHGLA